MNTNVPVRNLRKNIKWSIKSLPKKPECYTLTLIISRKLVQITFSNYYKV